MHKNVLLSEGANGRGAAEEMSLFDLLNVLLIHRWLLMVVPACLVLVVGTYSLMQPRTWTATAAFMPQPGENRTAGLAGMASQFGLTLDAGQAGESPAFYVELIRSRAILGSLVDSTYTSTQDGAGPAALATLLDVGSTDDRIRRHRTIERLRDMIAVRTARETNVIHVAVSARDPLVAFQVAERLFAAVNEFNLDKRQVRAAAERRFVEERLHDASVQLRTAEDELQAFMERNRRWQESPQLTMGFERLQREVGRHQQLVIGLTDVYERARIDEVRNLPLVTVIEQPEMPVLPDGRGTVRRTLFALVVGFVIALALAFVRAFMRTTAASQRSDIELFEQLRSEAVSELRHPLRSMTKRMRHGASE